MATEQLLLCVEVTRDRALANLTARFGRQVIDLGDVCDHANFSTWLEYIGATGGALAIAELNRLAVSVAEGSQLHVDTSRALQLERLAFTPRAVVDALLESRERRILRYVEGIEQVGFEAACTEEDPLGPRYIAIPQDLRSDPRLKPHVADYEARVAERTSEREQAAREAQAAHNRTLAGVKAYAENVRRLSRAASEGYPILRPVMDHLTGLVRGIVAQGWACETAQLQVSKIQTASAPSLEAFAILDQIRQAVDILVVPDGVSVVVGRIGRVTIPWLGDQETCVVVPITIDPHLHPRNDTRQVLVFADTRRSAWAAWRSALQISVDTPPFVSDRDSEDA